MEVAGVIWALCAELTQRALLVAVCVSAPVLAIVLVAGVVINVVQSATLQSDSTTATGPRLLAAAVALALFGAWMLAALSDFWVELWRNIPNFLH
jgi:flagellar biosynthesis protein FliQ